MRGGEVVDLSNTNPGEFRRACIREIHDLYAGRRRQRPAADRRSLRAFSVSSLLRGDLSVISAARLLIF
jgi:hypothetical protein